MRSTTSVKPKTNDEQHFILECKTLKVFSFFPGNESLKLSGVSVSPATSIMIMPNTTKLHFCVDGL